ncbi:MAG: hydantoinase B/oxoprolinase family protein, partial [Planctomycetota bacterium]
PARAALNALLDEMRSKLEAPPQEEQALEGYLAIANERMAGAIRRISIQRGYDPADYALVAFGGAGGQHACAVAGLLGMERVIVPADAGLLSAYGLSSASVERFAETQVLELLERVESDLPERLNALARQATKMLMTEGVLEGETCIRRRIAELRFSGQETSLQIDIEGNASCALLRTVFVKQYAELYGFEPAEREVELVTLRVVASTQVPEKIRSLPQSRSNRTPPVPVGTQKTWFQNKWQSVPFYQRELFPEGSRISGPALVFEAHSAVVVEPGWDLVSDRAGALVIEREDASDRVKAVEGTVSLRPEAVRVELFSHRFEGIAREMGETLRRTSVSTNVKERLDFSCALLDAHGELVVNAPHIPVHLGSLGLCVRETVKRLALQEGDAAVTNHPAFGGSHLPDLTIITPIQGAGNRIVAYVAARAHHAEIGGILPGSMPPAARSLAEEGAVIPPVLVVKQHQPAWEAVQSLLQKPPWPTRALSDNLADLRAAVASCFSGVTAFKRLMNQRGEAQVKHYMNALKDRAEQRMRQAFAALPDNDYTAEERLDDGTRLCVKIHVSGDEASIDFTGSSGVHSGNLNATPAIVHSVVIYVLRLLVQEELPLNEGMMRPVRLVIPEGILNPVFPDDPAKAPSIVGGNVETSMRLVDTLIKALGIAAAGQGTMNNLLFGDDTFSYYETVCGGCGAGPGFAGASAVHCHMTNTRITDPELLEHRYPVRLDRFAVRRGSGGQGRYNGGDGAVREITFLKRLELSVLSQRRNEGPFGMAGGGAGKPGCQKVIRKSGKTDRLKAIDSCVVEPGDRLVLETPGGGGYGAG